MQFDYFKRTPSNFSYFLRRILSLDTPDRQYLAISLFVVMDPALNYSEIPSQPPPPPTSWIR